MLSLGNQSSMSLGGQELIGPLASAGSNSPHENLDTARPVRGGGGRPGLGGVMSQRGALSFRGTRSPVLVPRPSPIASAPGGVVEKSHITRNGSETDTAQLLAASAPHSGDWLQAPPVTAIGLRLTDEMIRVAVGFRLGANTCEPHECVCGFMVDARGLHGLCCKKVHRDTNDTHI